MKKYKILVIIILATIINSCAGDKKKLFSINESQFKLLYHQGDVLKLEINNLKNKNIDSVVYYNNENKIGISPKNAVFNYRIEQEKLGYQNLKAIIFFESDSTQTTTKIELVSNIEPKLLKYQIVATYPHDIKAYTQGLEFYKDTLIEGTGNGAGNGTGIKGVSSLRKTNYKTGAIYAKVELDTQYFGEGITVLNNKIYQLTWLNNQAYCYNAGNLKKEKTFTYFKKMEGWGLTNNGKNLLQTDGSEKIYVLNPNNFKPITTINVYTANNKIKALNELEWIDGKIYANIYQMDAIAIINPNSGAVEAVLDLSELKSKVTQHPDIDVLNGIAYNPKTKTIFVTGKNWDKMFELKISY